jgi:hypothetical protein
MAPPLFLLVYFTILTTLMNFPDKVAIIAATALLLRFTALEVVTQIMESLCLNEPTHLASV